MFLKYVYIILAMKNIQLSKGRGQFWAQSGDSARSDEYTDPFLSILNIFNNI